MKVAIVGSRHYPRLDLVRSYVASLPADTVVISGRARGVDRCAAAAARDRPLLVCEFPAEWSKFGRQAGLLRNAKIVAAADRVVAFWDGTSRGTRHTIIAARAAGKLGGIYDGDGRWIPACEFNGEAIR